MLTEDKLGLNFLIPMSLVHIIKKYINALKGRRKLCKILQYGCYFK